MTLEQAPSTRAIGMGPQPSSRRQRPAYRRSWDGHLLRQLPENPPRDWPTAGGHVLRILAAIAVPLSLAVDRRLVFVATTGVVVVIGLLPVWLPPFLKAPGGFLLLTVGAVAVLAGFVLSWVAAVDHDVALRLALQNSVRVTTFIAGIGALWWASRVIGLTWVVVLFGSGLLVRVLANPGAWELNPWKFGFSQPVVLIVLALVDRTRSTLLTLCALAALGAVSVLNDYRSLFAMLVITAIALLYQRLRRGSPRKPSGGAFVLGALGVAAVLYYTLTTLIVSGALGTGLKQRSEAQLESGGSLLLGGRPEWTVTVRLLQERPWGFGWGVQPSAEDIELGRQGFASIHLLSQENYLYNYVFRGMFRLHSITADLWAAAGAAGLLLVGVMLWLIVTSLAEQVALRTATAVLVYLSVRSVWDIGFSPIYSNLPGVALTVAVALVARTRAHEDRLAKERALAEAAGMREWKPPTLTASLPVIKPVERAP